MAEVELARSAEQPAGEDEQTVVQPFRLLLVVANVVETEILLPLARAIVGERHGQLIVMHVVTVPEAESLSEGAVRARQSRIILDRFLSEQISASARIETTVRVGRELWPDIWDMVEREQIDLLVVGWRTESEPQDPIIEMTDARLAAPPCDVMAVRLGPEVSGADWWQQVRQILVPVRGGISSALVLAVANTLAEVANASITMFHVTERPSGADQGWFAAFSSALRRLPRLFREVIRVGSVSTAILEEAGAYQVVVMGTPRWPASATDWAGPVLKAVAVDIRSSLIAVKERANPLALLDGRQPEEWSSAISAPSPVSVVVDKWFAESTFHSQEFADLERLLALKQAQGVTISLGLPAFNEARTVGNVIRTVKTALMDEVPLLDEIVLIDSGSTDATRQIAAELGVPVHVHQQILSEYEARRGKGEALWKSLYVLKGDIIAWIDTDIKNIHPRFVYGILGPLLRDTRIQYVKGFYRRPLETGGQVHPGEGGRVTELTFRPLINLFFPELSGLIQPLSGEYAGRRAILEQLPFFCGYGVETGLLIDILERQGLHAIAQVDLVDRVHRNQPLSALSKMSFAIIQVVIRRLEDRHRLRLLEEINKTMKLIRREPKRFYLEELEIREPERPPMITVPEYARLWQARGNVTEEPAASQERQP